MEETQVRDEEGGVVRAVGAAEDDLGDKAGHADGLFDGGGADVFSVLEFVLLFEAAGYFDPPVVG